MNAAMNNSAIIEAAASSTGLWLSPQVVAALLTLAGVIVGLVARDIVMTLYMARKKRTEDLADKKEAAGKVHHDLVRLYSDPLKDAVTSLKYRLEEIVEKKQGRYLHADAPGIPFLEYKRISTVYRIAAVLGWIRAIRRERSYLDPEQASASVEMQAIGELEAALADGTHVELQRLDELSNLWRVSTIDPQAKVHIASLIDGERAAYLAKKGALSSRDLPDPDQIELAERCAEIIRHEAGVDIPPDLVAATAKQTAVTFGIKEAYIYRDWQAAIGDLMLLDDKVGTRHFSVLGFGTFEDIILKGRKNKQSNAARWFARLEGLIHDLDMTREGMFDARRDQVRKLYQCCIKLEAGLEQRLSAKQEG
ncbi:hypothetical protein [Sphingomonas sp. G-3-2-10]|uniref:hypothetical protein n=1 Tax=Sphingomonas sp. G-3-2-10 TaxID=2728838 RepID=UPI00146D4FE2|nr:hypothetical protein [Sphingomonas sp. G-3-2-10]NML06796.1 hypothetical protein [Sphingomonas sp. G-3-2-10]